MKDHRLRPWPVGMTWASVKPELHISKAMVVGTLGPAACGESVQESGVLVVASLPFTLAVSRKGFCGRFTHRHQRWVKQPYSS